MSRPLAKIALTSFVISTVSFLASMAILVAEPTRTVSLGDILDWDGSRKRCINELGDAGERPTVRELVWEGRDEIRLDVPGTLHYRPGTRDTIEVRGPAYLLAHLEWDDNSIGLDCSPRRNTPRIEIEMAGEDLREFSIRGLGDMVLEGLNEPRVEIVIGGRGSIKATGEVGRLSLSIAGSGDADLGGLVVRDMEIAIAGSGDAIVSPLDSLKVSIAGSGDVDMLTDPDTIETSIIGSGRVTRPSAAN